jgi:hypothetical protein
MKVHLFIIYQATCICRPWHNFVCRYIKWHGGVDWLFSLSTPPLKLITAYFIDGLGTRPSNTYKLHALGRNLPMIMPYTLACTQHASLT